VSVLTVHAFETALGILILIYCVLAFTKLGAVLARLLLFLVATVLLWQPLAYLLSRI
jgi:hypothetical protein